MVRYRLSLRNSVIGQCGQPSSSFTVIFEDGHGENNLNDGRRWSVLFARGGCNMGLSDGRLKYGEATGTVRLHDTETKLDKKKVDKVIIVMRRGAAGFSEG